MNGSTDEKKDKLMDELLKCPVPIGADISKKAECLMNYINKSIPNYKARIEETNNKVILYIVEQKKILN